MATRTIEELIDDMDGGPASESVFFALDNTAYEIDLNEVNAKELRTDLQRYIANARKVGRTGRTGAPRASAARKPPVIDKEQRAAIRDWANKHGFAVGDRGRLPDAAVQAFEAAHK